VQRYVSSFGRGRFSRLRRSQTVTFDARAEPSRLAERRETIAKTAAVRPLQAAIAISSQLFVSLLD
jgi:hypothetical protein